MGVATPPHFATGQSRVERGVGAWPEGKRRPMVAVPAARLDGGTEPQRKEEGFRYGHAPFGSQPSNPEWKVGRGRVQTVGAGE